MAELADKFVSAAAGGNVVEVSRLLRIPELSANSREKPGDDGDGDGESVGRTALTAAAMEGSQRVVEMLLRREEIDVNEGDNFFHPLLAAAFRGNAAIVELLLARTDIDVNKSNAEGGKTPLRAATEKKQLKAVEILLADERVDPNLVGNDGLSPLCVAILLGSHRLVALLLSNPRLDVTAGFHNDSTALHEAAGRNNGLVIRELLGHADVDVNATNSDGGSALHAAAICDSAAAVRALLDGGGEALNVNLENQDGETPLDIAARKEQPEVMEALLAHPDTNVNRILPSGRSLLQSLVWDLLSSDLRGECVAALLRCPRIDVSAGGAFPLHEACQRGSKKIVSALVESRLFDVNQGVGEWEETPLMAACTSDRGVATLSALIAASDRASLDLDLNKGGWRGATALHQAIKRGRRGAVKMLSEQKDIDMNRRDADGDCPLSAVVEFTDLRMLSLLLSCPGVDVNQALFGSGDATLLHAAVDSGRADVLKTVLGCRRVDVNRRDSAGRTALHVAVQNEDAEAVEAILTLRKDASVNAAEGRNGFSPLQTAAYCNKDSGVLRLLLARPDVDVNRTPGSSITALGLMAWQGRRGSAFQMLLGDWRLNAQSLREAAQVAEKFGDMKLEQALNSHAKPSEAVRERLPSKTVESVRRRRKPIAAGRADPRRGRERAWGERIKAGLTGVISGML